MEQKLLREPFLFDVSEHESVETGLGVRLDVHQGS